MGDRVAVLKDGLLQQVGTPRELYDHPDNVFVAGFIGSPAMNLIEAPLTEGGANVRGALVPLPREVLTRAGDAGLKSVTVGFRPEDVTLTERRPRAASRSRCCWSRSSAPTPTSTARCSCRTAATKQIIARTDGRRPPGKGETVHITVKEGHAHVFSPADGERLS